MRCFRRSLGSTSSADLTTLDRQALRNGPKDLSHSVVTVAESTTSTTSSTSPPASGSFVWSRPVLEEELAFFRAMNDLRVEGFRCPSGRSFARNPEPLTFDCHLWRTARLHSEDMAKNNYFSHTNLQGLSPWQRAELQEAQAHGENIAAGYKSALETLRQWKESDAHCVNMMSPDMKRTSHFWIRPPDPRT